VQVLGGLCSWSFGSKLVALDSKVGFDCVGLK
jgi:hypothetical protein